MNATITRNDIARTLAGAIATLQSLLSSLDNTEVTLRGVAGSLHSTLNDSVFPQICQVEGWAAAIVERIPATAVPHANDKPAPAAPVAPPVKAKAETVAAQVAAPTAVPAPAKTRKPRKAAAPKAPVVVKPVKVDHLAAYRALKAECEAKGLPTTGKADALKSRLAAYTPATVKPAAQKSAPTVKPTADKSTLAKLCKEVQVTQAVMAAALAKLGLTLATV